ncbi:MAG: uncharacterized protein KVP18_001054 [Porospora cf. gigantea A]|uniref:uncharacterized protein n=1 Tax=Porospora cf. gigantea A TaxID=2853593 RepID=UPI00355A0B4B|nr:MAG: hypothetical protein KVP18_001054 [Porospora cf. gigantea A]
MGNRSSVNQPCAAGLGFATTLDLLLQDFVTRFVDVCQFHQCYDPLNATSPVRRLAPLLRQLPCDDPDSLRDALEAAKAYEDRTQCRRAICAFQQAETLVDDEGQDGSIRCFIKLAIGELYVKLNLLDCALLAFQQADELNPGNLGILYRIGNILKRLDRNNEAEDSFRRCLEKEPNHVESLFDLSCVFLAQNRLYDAEEKLVHLLSLRPQLQPAAESLAQIYDTSGRHWMALDLLTRHIPPGSRDHRMKARIEKLRRRCGARHEQLV